MGAIFFWLWVILIAIFDDYFWLITIGLIVSYIILKSIPEIIRSISKRRVENRKYHEMLKEVAPKVQNINLELYQKFLMQLEKIYKSTYRQHKAILKDSKGRKINICPKCGGYMKIAKGWKGLFLGCSNYHESGCRSTRDYSEIFNIKV